LAQVINLQDALSARTQRPPPLSSAGQPGAKGDVYRAILLLDIAVQQAHLLVRTVPDASQRQHLEMQLATIEKLIHVARHMASAL
jgi:hypothetical protein